jgi:hypothetical protein
MATKRKSMFLGKVKAKSDGVLSSEAIATMLLLVGWTPRLVMTVEKK